MKETVDTLGHQRGFNYALMQPNKEAFIKAVTDGLTPPPAYFPHNVRMNKSGYTSVHTVLEKGSKGLSPTEFKNLAQSHDALILDTRNADDFSKGHIPGSINIGVDGQFAPWVGAMIGDVNQEILLVTPENRAEEVTLRLSRVGFDNVLGTLDGGIPAWKEAGFETDTVERISAEQFTNEITGEFAGTPVLDVRKPGEFNLAHYENAQNLELDAINEWFSNIDDSKTNYIHCAGGYRSMIAASILKARGIHNFKEVAGGWGAISKTNIPQTTGSCSLS